jgi:hypothetical protein
MMSYTLPDDFDASRPSSPGRIPACATVTAHHLDVSPGDMTRYRLTVVPRQGGGLIVLWDAAVWYTSTDKGDDWLSPQTQQAAQHNAHTTAAIVAMLDEHVR